VIAVLVGQHNADNSLEGHPGGRGPPPDFPGAEPDIHQQRLAGVLDGEGVSPGARTEDDEAGHDPVRRR